MGSSLSGHKAKLTGRLPTNVDNKRPQVSPHPPHRDTDPKRLYYMYLVCVVSIEREWNSCQSFAVIGLEHVPKYIPYYTILYMNQLRGERNANCRFWFWSCDYKRFLPQRHGMSLDTTGRVERERERERDPIRNIVIKISRSTPMTTTSSQAQCVPPVCFSGCFWSECIHECTHIQF